LYSLNGELEVRGSNLIFRIEDSNIMVVLTDPDRLYIS
jgi:hypothetical protein